MTIREPRLIPVPIKELRPTQITVGMREVKAKRKRWEQHKGKEGFLGSHMIPVIVGPKGRFYVIDHHHLVPGPARRGTEGHSRDRRRDLSRLKRTPFSSCSTTRLDASLR